MSGLVTAARRKRNSRQAAPAAASTGASSFRLSAAQEAAVLETRSHVIKNLRILIWVSLVLQWNCICRPINLDALDFHNMQKGLHDSSIISYSNNKKDQTGNKVFPKDCYTKPFKPAILFVLVTGCYLCINQDRYNNNRRSDKIFIKTGRQSDLGERLAQRSF